MASVCIICHQEKSGAAVADTTVIRTIRAIKEKLHMASGNTLVVCPDCLTVHAARRKKYEGKWITNVLIGLVLALLAIALPLLTGNLLQQIPVVIFLLLFAGLVAALALLDYTPPLARTPGEVPAATSLPAPPAVPMGVKAMNWMSAASAKTPAPPASKPSARAKPMARARPRPSLGSKGKSSSKSKPAKSRRRR